MHRQLVCDKRTVRDTNNVVVVFVAVETIVVEIVDVRFAAVSTVRTHFSLLFAVVFSATGRCFVD